MRSFQRLAASAALCCALGSPAAALQVGDPAPDFSLVDTNGQTWTLSALRGKVVLVALFGYN
jgi:cytochrome oxidase Cu insertion factor (SCO1/SenC/PrrC family)